MSAQKVEETLLIIDPLPVAGQGGPTTLSSRRIPIAALKANMSSVLSEVGQMFGEAREVLGHCRIDNVEISLAISMDGSIGLLGTELAAGAKGAIKLRLKFDEGLHPRPEVSQPHRCDRSGVARTNKSRRSALKCRCPLMAHHDIALRCNDLSAFGGTLACRPPGRIYEFTP